MIIAGSTTAHIDHVQIKVYYAVDYTFNNGSNESNVTVLDFIARNGASSAGVALDTALIKAENQTTALTAWSAIVSDTRMAGSFSGAYSPTMRGFEFRPTAYTGTWSSASGTVTMEAFYVPARPTGYTPGTVTFDYYAFRALEGLFVHNDNGGDYDLRAEGDSLPYMLFLDASAATENIALLTDSAPNWQSMDRGVFIGNATTVPTGNPSAGGFLYAEAGALKYRGSGGTVTTIANA